MKKANKWEKPDIGVLARSKSESTGAPYTIGPAPEAIIGPAPYKIGPAPAPGTIGPAPAPYL